MALSPQTGSIIALVGGFDFSSSKFNRAADALRQPGSSFKPFIYSAALEKGWTPATLLDDKPGTFLDSSQRLWRPENYRRRYHGSTRVREALTFSLNLASIHLLQNIGIDYGIEYAKRFGFDKRTLPNGLSLALGSGVITPLELASSYAVFANDGFRVSPYLIERIEDADGRVLFSADPAVVCSHCSTTDPVSLVTSHAYRTQKVAPPVIDPRNVYQMHSMMQDVMRRGTARRALTLKRSDIAGKTGTTNDHRDAWFCGYQKDIVTTTWVGFDQSQPLGRGETGGHSALPMWIEFMRAALDGKPDAELPRPPGLITVRINADTARLTTETDPNAVMETIRKEYRHTLLEPIETDFAPGSKSTAGFVKEQDDINLTKRTQGLE